MRKKIMKSVLAAALSVTMILSCPAMSNIALARTETAESEGKSNEAEIQTLSAEDEIEAYASTDVAINEANFPDATFRQYVKNEIDTDWNGVLSSSEIGACTYIDCSDMEISSLKGIEIFYNLETLSCEWNQLTSLDVSKNTALEYLNCYHNALTSLDVSKNTALESLYCSWNQLTSLDVSQNTALIDLDCSDNALTSLDVSKNTGLTVLDCYHNALTSLDVSQNTALTDLNCPYNALTSLDVSKNTALESLDCSGNELTSLDVSKNTALESLNCSWNQLTSLDVSKNTALEYLDCSDNALTSLITNSAALEYLRCYHNALTSLDVSKNTGLKYLYCSGNELTSLITNSAALTGLNCSYNELTSLDVRKNTGLTGLDCSDNALTSLDVSKNTALESLRCYHNALTSLDVSKNTALESLNCSYNELTSLDVRKNTGLTGLDCSDNALTSLITNSAALEYLDCYHNALTSLDVSKNTALESLRCYHNALTSLDVSKNTALKELDCYGNHLNSVDTSKNTNLQWFILLNTPVVNTPTKVSTGVEVSWGKSIGADGYYVYRRMKGGSWTRIAEVEGEDTLSYIDKTATASNTYDYTIRGYYKHYKYDEAGNKIEVTELSGYDKNGRSITIASSALATPKITAVSNEATGVKITWGKVTGAAKYRVYYKTGSGSWTKLADTTSTCYTWKGAKSGMKYTFTVRCISSDGKKTTSDYDKTGKSITIPASTTSIGKPTVNTLTKVSNGVKVSWSKVSGANSYYIYRRTKGGSWSRLAIVNGGSTVSYTDTTVKASTTYEYTVRAYNGNTLGDYDKTGKSITIPASTTSIGKPAVNTLTKVSNGVKVSWSKVSGASSYYVYRRTKGGSWSRLAIVNGGSTVSYTDTTVKAGTTYEYTVRAYNGKTLGDYDKNGKGITIPASTTSIGKPAVNTLTKVSNGVKVSWSKVSGASSYYVYRRTKGGSWSRLAVVNGGSTVSYTDTSVKAGTTYDYTVRAYDGKTLGDYDKNGKSITIPASTTSIGKPTVNMPTKVSNGVKVSWSKVSGAASYYVYRRTKGGSWSRLAIVNGGSTVSYTDTSVKAGTTYEYTVRAYDGKALGDYDKNGKSITVTK